MKWAKYFGLILLSFCLFFGLSPLKQVDAKTLDEFPVVFIGKHQFNTSDKYSFFVCNYDNVSVSLYSEEFVRFDKTIYSVGYAYDYVFDTMAEAVTFYNNNYQTLQISATFSTVNVRRPIVVLKGTIYNYNNIPDIYNSYNDYEDSITPSWWERVKSAFMDFVGSEALSDVLSGNWLAYIEDVLFGELWTIKVGEGEDDMIIPDTVSATPSPSPTPIPTPIPYSTVIDPGTGEIHYHYSIDVSGTPVPTSSIYPPVTSAPPGPGSGSTIDEPVAVEDYYEPDDSLSVPKLRIFKFLLRMTGNDVDIGMDSLDDNMAVMDATLEDNAEAISGVGDLFQLIPVKWFILVGTLACFPVIAAMIKSLLGG